MRTVKFHLKTKDLIMCREDEWEETVRPVISKNGLACGYTHYHLLTMDNGTEHLIPHGAISYITVSGKKEDYGSTGKSDADTTGSV